MFAQKPRVAVMFLALSMLPASQTQACEFLRRCFGGGCGGCGPTYTAAYAPACCPAPCPQPCAQQCVSYMPQTCYRTVYCNVPVVAYRPITTCDPCTGCPRTCMQPVTTFVAQPRLVPYTSYRPVVTANYAPCGTGCGTGCGTPCATGCGTGCGTGCATPTMAAYPVMPAPAPCCTPASVAVGAPAAQLVPAPAAAVAVPAPGVPYGNAVPQPAPAPSLAPQGVAPPVQTFENPAVQQGSQTRMQPLRLSPPTYPTSEPRALDPEHEDRVTSSQPVRQAMAVRTVSAATTSNNDGWRAARD